MRRDDETGERVEGEVSVSGGVGVGGVQGAVMVLGAKVGGEKLEVGRDGTVDVTGRRGKFVVTFGVATK